MSRIELDYAELGVAWQQSKLPALPPIFTWPYADRVPADLGGALDAAGARLRDRGLIDSRGELRDDLYGALRRFAYAPFEIDLRFALKPTVELRAAVTADDRTGVLGVLVRDTVVFGPCPADTAIDALVRELDELSPARGTAISLSKADVETAMAEAAENGDGDDAMYSALRRRGVSSDDARLFLALVGGRRYRYGKFGLAVRDRRGTRRRSDRFVQVIDKGSGRTALYQRREYLVAAPADRALFVRVLTELRDYEQRRISDDW